MKENGGVDLGVKSDGGGTGRRGRRRNCGRHVIYERKIENQNQNTLQYLSREISEMHYEVGNIMGRKCYCYLYFHQGA